uniref:Uncharacterized protein n=1 Tax=Timema tahoe TaxID=61484 RepID=A0A7R9ISP5_9NEOP|nr:unnamed protein product [Timema tahoe]
MDEKYEDSSSQDERSRLSESQSTEMKEIWNSLETQGNEQCSMGFICTDNSREDKSPETYSARRKYVPLSKRAYEETLQISGEKFRDLQHLKTFCGDEVKAYFDNLKYEKKENK